MSLVYCYSRGQVFIFLILLFGIMHNIALA